MASPIAVSIASTDSYKILDAQIELYGEGLRQALRRRGGLHVATYSAEQSSMNPALLVLSYGVRFSNASVTDFYDILQVKVTLTHRIDFFLKIR